MYVQPKLLITMWLCRPSSIVVDIHAINYGVVTVIKEINDKLVREINCLYYTIAYLIVTRLIH